MALPLVGFVGPHPIVRGPDTARGPLSVPFGPGDRAVIVLAGSSYLLTCSASGQFDPRTRTFAISDLATHWATFPATGRGAAASAELMAALKIAAPFDAAELGLACAPTDLRDFDIVAGDFDRVPMKLKLELVKAAGTSQSAFAKLLDTALTARRTWSCGSQVFRFEDVGRVDDVMLHNGRALVVFDSRSPSVPGTVADFYDTSIEWPAEPVAHTGGAVVVHVIGFRRYESSDLPAGATFADLATDLFGSTHTVQFYSRDGPVGMPEAIIETHVLAVRLPRASTVRRITALQAVRQAGIDMPALYKYYRTVFDAQQPPGAAIGGSGILELPPCLHIARSGKNPHRKHIALTLHHAGVASALQGLKLREFKETTAPRLVAIAGDSDDDTRRFNQMLRYLHWFSQQGGGGNGGPTCHGSAYCPYRDQSLCKFRAASPYVATAIKLVNGSAAPKRYSACDTCNPAKGKPNAAVVQCTDFRCPPGSAQCATCFLTGKACLGCNTRARGGMVFRLQPPRRKRTASGSGSEPKRACPEPVTVAIWVDGTVHDVASWDAIVGAIGSSTAQFYGFGELVPVGDGIPVCECVFRSQNVPTSMWNAFAGRGTEPAVITAPTLCGRCGEA